MFTLKTVDTDGVVKEITFDDRREAASLLRDLFGDALKTEARYNRDTANSALRAAYRDNGGVEQFFAECRRRSEAANNK